MPPRRRRAPSIWIAGAALAVSVVLAVRGNLGWAALLWTGSILLFLLGPWIEVIGDRPRIPDSTKALSPARWDGIEGTLRFGEHTFWLVPRWQLQWLPLRLVSPRDVVRIREASILEASLTAGAVTVVFLDTAEERVALRIEGLHEPADLVERVRQGSVRVI